MADAAPLDCRFDAHCHLFGSGYLFREAGHMLNNALLGKYPHQSASSDDAFPKAPISGIKDFLRWLEEMAGTVGGNEADNYKTLYTETLQANADKLPISVVPLMMDVYYLFSAPLGAHESAPSGKKAYGFREWTLQWPKDLDPVLQKKLVPNWTERLHDRLRNRLRPSLFLDTRGFRYQRLQLVSLQRKHRNNVFPFLAVDPRRTGLIKAILQGRIPVGKGLSFCGIKLYPRLGYHPQCEELWPLYEWCAAHRVPITTHADRIGFPTPGLERLLGLDYGEYGNPKNFVPILEAFPKLVIDFAHFGMSEPQWADCIADLMQHYSGVFGDLSCYTSLSCLKSFKARQWQKKLVQQRTLFGTDFDVMYYVAPGINLQEYYQNVHNCGFSTAEWSALTCDTPKRFLGLNSGD
ncbi:MAG TPA: amidohydrolase family protein [Fibrobacteraceae bacterium]|nr:amidohydrolase family protein [Fibrobacteraceae bacterium]